jgi:cytochrome b involved in lipid metabolism
LFGETGRDATEAFEDVGHSDEARTLLEKYYVGVGPEVSAPL